MMMMSVVSVTMACVYGKDKIGFHSQLPGVGIERGVFGVPGTSNTSSLYDFEKMPFCFTGSGMDGVLCRFGMSAALSLLVAGAVLADVTQCDCGKFVSSMFWFSSSASKSEMSNLLMMLLVLVLRANESRLINNETLATRWR
jgi:hypothetical protein